MKILLDTNVLLNPDLGETILRTMIERGMIPVVTDYILDEVTTNIEEVYSDPKKAAAILMTLLDILHLGGEIKQWDEYVHHLDEAFRLIIEEDAPVLAAAMLPDIDLLITDDKDDFLKNKRLQGTPWRGKIKSPRGEVRPESWTQALVNMDVFTRGIRGWQLMKLLSRRHQLTRPGEDTGQKLQSRSLDQELTLTALRRALAQRIPQTHHSDQGIHYAAPAYVAALQAAGVQINMTEVGEVVPLMSAVKGEVS